MKKMHDLGWTDPQTFSDANEENVLQHALARYHACDPLLMSCSATTFLMFSCAILVSFLDLLSSSSTLFVPTLDIDLAWHTHQLLGSLYHNDCLSHIGRFIDQ